MDSGAVAERAVEIVARLEGAIENNRSGIGPQGQSKVILVTRDNLAKCASGHCRAYNGRQPRRLQRPGNRSMWPAGLNECAAEFMKIRTEPIQVQYPEPISVLFSSSFQLFPCGGHIAVRGINMLSGGHRPGSDFQRESTS